MDFLQILKDNLVRFISFLGSCPMLGLQKPPSSSTSSTSDHNDLETPQPESSEHQSQQQLPASASSDDDDLKLVSILAAQQHYLQWKNSVLSFCFTFALNNISRNGSDFSSVLTSFLVLLTFQLHLVALFISPRCTKIAELLDKVACLVAAALFSHAIAIPFPFELKSVVLAVFLVSLLFIVIFNYLMSRVKGREQSAANAR